MFSSSKTLMLALLVIWSAPAFCAESAGAPADANAINKLIGRGINIGNALESPNEGDWDVTLHEEYFQLIKDAGFNSIRQPVRWDSHALEKPPYTIDPNFMARIDWVAKNALSRNLVLIFNMHNYYDLYSDPNGHKERFIAIWKQIAEHFKDYPNTLLFEFLNEPQGKLDAAKWNALLKDTLAVVRQSNPNRTIVIGPANYNDVYKIKTLELPKDDRNIIVTFHYYSPYRFTHQGAHWAKDANNWLGMKWTASEDEKRLIAKDFDLAAKWGKENGRPIYLGEFGAFNKADMESRICWTKCVVDTAAQRGFSLSYWEFCSGFGLYNQQTKSWNKGLLDAVIPPAVSLPALSGVEGPNPPKQ
jgi:endoglucanase